MNDTGLIARAVKVLSDVESNELKATLVSTLFVFVLMTSYYILRPVRDAMASDWSDSEVSFLWILNFFISAAIVAIYGFAVSRVRLKFVVPTMYAFFAATFVAFYLGISTVADAELVDKAFYLWVSVFALFHVSIFWTFMADTFSKAQAKRLFAIIATGATGGSLVGPLALATVLHPLENVTLMLIVSLGLLTVIPLTFYLYYLKRTELGNAAHAANVHEESVGGKWWQGFKAFVTSPYLVGIAAFILLYTFVNSFVYFEQKNLLVDFSRVERRQILAGISLITNLLTFGLALFVTGRVVNKVGMPTALASLPVLICIGLIILAFAPWLTIVLAIQVVRSGFAYGLTRPAREMLYTNVSQEDRFKAKPVIDIVVYRGGDAVSSSLFALLTDGLGLGLAAVAAVGSAIATAWAWVGIRLGRAFDRTSTPD